MVILESIDVRDITWPSKMRTTSFPGGGKMSDPGNEVEMRIGQTRKTNKQTRKK